MAVVVSDTSPIRALALLDLLHLLAALYDRVLIPPAVAHELSVPVVGVPVFDIAQIKAMTLCQPADAEQVRRLRESLGTGESEAIALALEIRPEALLIDEDKGRRIALSLGLKPLGVLGLLAQAKRRGLIPSVAPLMVRLEREINFRLSAQVKQRVLELAGEA